MFYKSVIAQGRKELNLSYPIIYQFTGRKRVIYFSVGGKGLNFSLGGKGLNFLTWWERVKYLTWRERVKSFTWREMVKYLTWKERVKCSFGGKGLYFTI